jgi:hypothetical protein
MRGDEYADCPKQYQTMHQPSAAWFHDANLLLRSRLTHSARARKLQVSESRAPARRRIVDKYAIITVAP